MSNEIKFVVLGDVKDLEKNLAKAQKGFSTVAKVSAAAFSGMTASAYGFIKSAQQQELAINSLNQALKNQGNYSDAASKDLQKYASALQEVSLFGDETVIQAQAMIASFGFEGETLKSLTKATLDLAQAKGMDLVAAADLVSKSVGSTTNALTRYGVQVDGVAGSQQRAASAVENINRLFGGQAEAATKGLGSTIVLKNAMSDLAEEIGIALAPSVIDLTGRIKSLVDYLKENPEFAKQAADFLVLGIKITAVTTAFALLGKAWLSLIPIVKALNTQLVFLNAVSFMGLNTSVAVLVKNMGLLYPAVMIVGAAFVSWNIGKWISDVTGLSDAVASLGSRLGEIRAQKLLGDDYISEEDFNAKREEWAAQAEAARQREIEAEQAHNIAKKTLQDEQLARYAEFQAQMQGLSALDLTNLMTKLQQETDVTKNFEQQKTQIIQKELKARDALREADKSSQLAMISFAQQMVQAFGKESKAAFYILKALRIAEILVNSFAADMNIMAVWAWNPPVAAQLMGMNHLLTGLSIAGVVGTAIAGYAEGSPKIPRDMVANIHKKEMIIPATFSDAIRSGDLSLSGGGSPGGGVSFDFTGATFNGVTETFVREIFTRASEAINNRTLSPLPA